MKHIKIDEQSKFLLIAILFSVLFFNNGIYMFLPFAALYVILYYLQQPYRPGVFSVIASYHFVNIIAGVWLCSYLGKNINYRSPSQATAIVACSVGLVFLMWPLIYIQDKIPAQTHLKLRVYAEKFSSEKVMYAYIVSYFITSSLGSAAFGFGGLTQVIFSFVKIKWILFLLFGFICFLKNENKKIFYLFVAFEFLSGFLSFFSDFKTVIFYLAVLTFSLVERLNFKQVFTIVTIGVALGIFGLIWTNIKGDYRSYLNSGSTQQVVGVESNDAFNKLYDLSSRVDDEKLNGSVIQMLDRLQYTYHFAKTIDRMPSVLPFEKGGNWLSSLAYATTPRFLNQGKSIFDATAKVRKYTGLRYLGKEQGVSFSLGYFADCFIDLGLPWMVLILALLGWLYSRIYLYLLKNASKNMLFNYCVVCAFFMEFSALETDSTMLLGRLFSNFLTFFLVIKFFFPWLMNYMSAAVEKKEPVILHDPKLAE